MITGDEKPTCTACDKATTMPPALLCPRCQNRLGANLDELSTGHARLDPAPRSSTRHGGRGAPGFGSRSPARDDVLVLTDPRRGAGARSDDEKTVCASRSVLRCVAGWADRAREARVLAPRRVDASWVANELPRHLAEIVLVELVARSRRDVASEVAALLDVLDEVACQWWVADMVADVESLLWHVRRALDELEPTVPIGACPVVPDGAAEAWTASWTDLPPRLGVLVRESLACGGQLRARVWGERATCARCGACWRSMEQLRELGRLLGGALLDLPGLSRYLGTPVSTLTTWAHRDGWTKHGRRGRRLYPLEQARASWWAAWERAHPVHGCALPPVHGCEVPPGWQRSARGWFVVERDLLDAA